MIWHATFEFGFIIWRENLRSALGIVVISLVAGVLSFFAVLHLLNSSVPNTPTSADTAPDVASQLKELTICTSQKKMGTDCELHAARTLALIKRVVPGPGNFHHSSKFKILVLDKYITLSKSACSAVDIAVDEFHWRIWPVDPGHLPDRWKDSGFVSGVQKFSTSGIKIDDTCLLVFKIPFSWLKSIEIGQYDRVAKKWDWRVSEEV